MPGALEGPGLWDKARPLLRQSLPGSRPCVLSKDARTNTEVVPRAAVPLDSDAPALAFRILRSTQGTGSVLPGGLLCVPTGPGGVRLDVHRDAVEAVY